MERRIHEVLDGARPAEELTSEERARLADYRRAMERELEALEREPVPDLAPAVMARIASLEKPAEGHPTLRDRLSGVLAWIWRPTPVRLVLRPAHGLMAAGLGFLLLTTQPTAPGGPEGGIVPVASAPEADARVLVQFRLDAPDAQAVALVGDFTDWQPAHPMRQQAPGVWTVVVPLEPGVHDYGFMVDGEQWRTDPLAAQVADGFGGTNSRMALLPLEAEERS